MPPSGCCFVQFAHAGLETYVHLLSVLYCITEKKKAKLFVSLFSSNS